MKPDATFQYYHYCIIITVQQVPSSSGAGNRFFIISFIVIIILLILLLLLLLLLLLFIYCRCYWASMRRKLGLLEVDGGEEDQELITDLLQVMHDTGADFTNTFRRLANFPMLTTHPQGWSLHP